MVILLYKVICCRRTVSAASRILTIMSHAMSSKGYSDPYKILGVDRDANDTTIRNAYIQLAKRYHPDKNTGDVEASEMFIHIQNAYRIIMEKFPCEGDTGKEVPYSFTISPLGVETEPPPRWFENTGIRALIYFVSFICVMVFISSSCLGQGKEELDESENNINKLVNHYKAELLRQEMREKKITDARKKLEVVGNKFKLGV